MLFQEENQAEKIRAEYIKDVDVLVKYLPWLEKINGGAVSKYYEGDEKMKLIKIPVYDSTLLAFVKEAGTTKFIDRNYPYVYTRYKIKSHDDERKLIENAHLKDIDIFKGILSKYVLGGRVKGAMWVEGVEENLYFLAIDKLRKLFYFTNVD